MIHYSEFKRKRDGFRHFFEYVYKPDGNEFVHIVSDHDRLDLLSYRFYGTPDLWWFIAVANGIVDVHNLKVGKKIVIPKLSKIL